MKESNKKNKELSFDDIQDIINNDNELTFEELKKLSSKILRAKTLDVESVRGNEIAQLLKMHLEKFTALEDDDKSKFNRHFIEIYPKYTGVCEHCNKEIDVIPQVFTVCPNCGKNAKGIGN